MSAPTVVCVGLAVLDLVFATAELPTSPGKHFASDFREVGGGPAANGAATVAVLGGDARFIGPVGDDARGDRILADLAALGVEVSRFRRIAGVASSVSAVLVDSGGDRLIVNRTDDELLTGAEPVGDEDLAEAGAVLADARWLAGAEAAIAAAARKGVPSVLDYDVTSGELALERLAATHVVFSQPALAGLSGEAVPRAGLGVVRTGADGWLAVTAGADGVYWLEEGEVRHLPALDVEVVDTLGAGDVFHGAFTLALAEHRPEEEALRFATVAAGLKCTRFGGRAGIPRRSDVDAQLDAS